MFKLFIKRPILSGVISVIIVCLGVLSILTLPITQFPDIVPPSVTVTARYTGAKDFTGTGIFGNTNRRRGRFPSGRFY